MTFRLLEYTTYVLVTILSITVLVKVEDWMDAVAVDLAMFILATMLLVGLSCVCSSRSFSHEILVSSSPVAEIQQDAEGVQYLNLLDSKYYLDSCYQSVSDAATLRNEYKVITYYGSELLNNGVKRVENIVRFE